MSCTALLLGLHLYTQHVKDNFNNLNPGVYAKCDSYVAGTYYNSIRKQTVYAGYVLPVGPIDIMVGAATGYNIPVVPMFVPSIVYKGVRVHLIIPTKMTGGGGIHVSIEKEF